MTITLAIRTRDARAPDVPRQPREPQPRDDGCHKSINASYGSLMRGPNPRDPGEGRRAAYADPNNPNPRDPGNGRLLTLSRRDPNPRDPPNSFIAGDDPNPRDPGNSRLFASGPQPRDDGKNRHFSRQRQRLAREPQPRDPGN